VGSDSRLMAYAPHAGSEPIWVSDTAGWGSGVRLVDVNGDGTLDLLASRWGPQFYGYGAPLELFRGTPQAFQTKPAWSSGTCGVGESIAVADLDCGALVEAVESFPIERPQAVVTLSKQIVEEIREVSRDGVRLGLGEYVALPGGNWISFKRRLRPGERVSVRYTHSDEPDIVLASTLDFNHVFHHRALR
jgi:hypothetical protein